LQEINQMQDQDLDSIPAIEINGNLLIAVTSNVRKLFENKEIKFLIKIRNNKLIIESPEILANLDFQDNIPESEAINVKY